MSQECSLFPHSTVYVPRVQSVSHVPRVQFMSPLEYSLCSQSAVSQECSLFQSTVYVPRVQFMSQEYSLCPFSTVY